MPSQTEMGNARDPESPGTPNPPPRASKKRAAALLASMAISKSSSSASPKRPRTRDRASPNPSNPRRSLDATTPTPTKRAVEKTKKETPKKDPKSAVDERISRAHTDRIFIVDHDLLPDIGNGASLKCDIIGSVGNIYKVWVKEYPSCTCPDHVFRRSRCKHIAYVLCNVLLATDEQVHQPSFSEEDLNRLMKSPVLKRVEAAKAAQNLEGNRKPIEGECAICFMTMKKRDQLVWCQSGCGNNLHSSCMNKWANSSGSPVRCVYCRAPWDCEKKMTAGEAMIKAAMHIERYVDVSEEFGMTGYPDSPPFRAYRNPFGSHEAEPNED